MSTNDEKEIETAKIMQQVEGLLKKAITLGAGAYFSAEEMVNNTVSKTLNTVQIPKGVLKQLVDEFIESYTISVQAEIKVVPKNKNKEVK